MRRHVRKVICSGKAFVMNVPTLIHQYEEPNALDQLCEFEHAELAEPWRW